MQLSNFCVPVIVMAGALVMAPIEAATKTETQVAHTYQVSVSGSDSNAGDERSPFRTIQHAVDVALPGDTVIVGDGTYTGTGAGTPCASARSRPVVCISRGGTSSARITIRARNKWAARIDGQSNTSSIGFRFLADANFLTIQGFDVFGMGNDSQSGTGLELYDGGHDTIIAENRIHDVGRLCTDVANGQTAIFVQQPRVTITKNVIHEIGRYAPGEYGCSPGNAYYQNHDHGVYLDGRTVPGASDALISNNLFYNHRRGWAIQVYPGTITNLIIANNTFAVANPYSVGHILIGASVRNGRIINNIFSDPLSVAINFYGGSHTNLVIAHNLSSEPLASRSPDGVTMLNNIERTNAELDGDFRPRPVSPAIDAGTRVPELPDDINGFGRPQGGGWDIGANEATTPRR